jgi:hypothetical protein
VAGGLGGFAAFAAVILASREVTVAELRALPSTIFGRG